MNNYKLPFTVDLEWNPHNRDAVNRTIKRDGISRGVNELGMTVFCRDSAGLDYSIVQLHKNRNLVRFQTGH